MSESTPILLGLLAKKRHGKDTFADYLVSHYNFEKDALAEPLKKVCRELFVLSDEQLYGDLKEVVDERYGVSTRQIMQFVGTELFRKQMNQLIPSLEDQIWVKLQEQRYLNAVKKNPKVRFVVADIRMPNEANMIKKLGGIIIKIVRPDFESSDQHSSEQIDLITNFDYEIINDGTLEEYYNKINKLMNTLINKSNLVEFKDV